VTSSLASVRAPTASVAAGRSPVHGALWGKGLELASQLLLVAAIPRALGPSDYGVFALALTVVTLTSLSMALGGPTLMSRYVPAAHPSERATVTRALLVRLARWRVLVLAGALVVGVTLVAASPSTFPPVIVLLVAIALVLDVAATLLFQAVLALGRTTAWSFRYGAQNLVLVAVALGGYALAGVDGAVAGVAVSAGVALAWGSALVAGPILQATRGASPPAGALRFGAVLAVGNSFVQLTHRGAIVAVALLAGSSVQTGFSALAVGIALAGTYAVWQLFVVQLPGLVEATREKPSVASAERSLRRLAFISLAGALAVALVGVALLQWAMPLVFGEGFEGAEGAAAVALAMLPLAPLTGIAAQAAALRLRPGLRAITTGAGLLAFTVTAFPAVRAWEATGASVALLTGTVVTVLAAATAFPGAIERRLLAAGLAGSALVIGVALATGTL
jgi:O-antigen/teichoic acid export membrane protein